MQNAYNCMQKAYKDKNDERINGKQGGTAETFSD
jgi:hypothetical protein